VLGSDRATPISDDYGSAESEFSGQVKRAEINLGADAQDVDPLFTTEARLRVAMARQ
jgi:hypothetical protein